MAIRNNLLGGIDFQDTGTTQLNGAINASTGTIIVDSTASFKSTGYIEIGSETIGYTATTGTIFIGCTRGLFGTAAATHSDNAIISEVEPLLVEDMNNTIDALVEKVRELSSFWLNSSLYDSLEDFESYSTGVFTTTGDWTITTSGHGSAGNCQIVSSTNAGGSGKELYIQCSYTNNQNAGFTANASYGGLTDNKHVFAKLYLSVDTSEVGDTVVRHVRVIVCGTTFEFTKDIGKTSLFIQALGSDTYNIYINGAYQGQVTGTLTLALQSSITSSNFGYLGVTYSRIYIDDIVQSKGTIS